MLFTPNPNFEHKGAGIEVGGAAVKMTLAPALYYQRADGQQISSSDCKFLREGKHPQDPDGPTQLIVGVPLTPGSDKLTEVWFPDNEFTRFYFPSDQARNAAHHAALAEDDQTRVG